MSVVPVVGVSVSLCCPCGECECVYVFSLWWVRLRVVPVVGVSLCCSCGGCECVCVVHVMGVSLCCPCGECVSVLSLWWA